MFIVIEAAEKEPTGFEGPMKHIPSQTRHCVVAVSKRPGITPTEAWKICRATLKKSGYMKSKDDGVPTKTTMRMTQKGTRRQLKHTFEKGSKKKHKEFARLSTKIKFGT